MTMFDIVTDEYLIELAPYAKEQWIKEAGGYTKILPDSTRQTYLGNKLHSFFGQPSRYKHILQARKNQHKSYESWHQLGEIYRPCINKVWINQDRPFVTRQWKLTQDENEKPTIWLTWYADTPKDRHIHGMKVKAGSYVSVREWWTSEGVWKRIINCDMGKGPEKIVQSF